MYAIRSYYERCIQSAGYQLDSILPEGNSLTVRKTANLHTGGTIHDVTVQLSSALKQAAIAARITSYNVCYTKLLRGGTLGKKHSKGT